MFLTSKRPIYDVINSRITLDIGLQDMQYGNRHKHTIFTIVMVISLQNKIWRICENFHVAFGLTEIEFIYRCLHIFAIASMHKCEHSHLQ
jgi:hypothetical protein